MNIIQVIVLAIISLLTLNGVFGVLQQKANDGYVEVGNFEVFRGEKIFDNLPFDYSYLNEGQNYLNDYAGLSEFSRSKNDINTQNKTFRNDDQKKLHMPSEFIYDNLQDKQEEGVGQLKNPINDLIGGLTPENKYTINSDFLANSTELFFDDKLKYILPRLKNMTNSQIKELDDWLFSDINKDSMIYQLMREYQITSYKNNNITYFDDLDVKERTEPTNVTTTNEFESLIHSDLLANSTGMFFDDKLKYILPRLKNMTNSQIKELDDWLFSDINKDSMIYQLMREYQITSYKNNNITYFDDLDVKERTEPTNVTTTNEFESLIHSDLLANSTGMFFDDKLKYILPRLKNMTNSQIKELDDWLFSDINKDSMIYQLMREYQITSYKNNNITYFDDLGVEERTEPTNVTTTNEFESLIHSDLLANSTGMFFDDKLKYILPRLKNMTNSQIKELDDWLFSDINKDSMIYQLMREYQITSYKNNNITYFDDLGVEERTEPTNVTTTNEFESSIHSDLLANSTELFFDDKLKYILPRLKNMTNSQIKELDDWLFSDINKDSMIYQLMREYQITSYKNNNITYFDDLDVEERIEPINVTTVDDEILSRIKRNGYSNSAEIVDNEDLNVNLPKDGDPNVSFKEHNEYWNSLTLEEGNNIKKRMRQILENFLGKKIVTIEENEYSGPVNVTDLMDEDKLEKETEKYANSAEIMDNKDLNVNLPKDGDPNVSFKEHNEYWNSLTLEEGNNIKKRMRQILENFLGKKIVTIEENEYSGPVNVTDLMDEDKLEKETEKYANSAEIMDNKDLNVNLPKDGDPNVSFKEHNEYWNSLTLEEGNNIKKRMRQILENFLGKKIVIIEENEYSGPVNVTDLMDEDKLEKETEKYANSAEIMDNKDLNVNLPKDGDPNVSFKEHNEYWNSLTLEEGNNIKKRMRQILENFLRMKNVTLTERTNNEHILDVYDINSTTTSIPNIFSIETKLNDLDVHTDRINQHENNQDTTEEQYKIAKPINLPSKEDFKQTQRKKEAAVETEQSDSKMDSLLITPSYYSNIPHTSENEQESNANPILHQNNSKTITKTESNITPTAYYHPIDMSIHKITPLHALEIETTLTREQDNVLTTTPTPISSLNNSNELKPFLIQKIKSTKRPINNTATAKDPTIITEPETTTIQKIVSTKRPINSTSTVKAKDTKIITEPETTTVQESTPIERPINNTATPKDPTIITEPETTTIQKIVSTKIPINNTATAKDPTIITEPETTTIQKIVSTKRPINSTSTATTKDPTIITEPEITTVQKIISTKRPINSTSTPTAKDPINISKPEITTIQKIVSTKRPINSTSTATTRSPKIKIEPEFSFEFEHVEKNEPKTLTTNKPHQGLIAKTENVSKNIAQNTNNTNTKPDIEQTDSKQTNLNKSRYIRKKQKDYEDLLIKKTNSFLSKINLNSPSDLIQYQNYITRLNESIYRSNILSINVSEQTNLDMEHKGDGTNAVQQSPFIELANFLTSLLLSVSDDPNVVGVDDKSKQDSRKLEGVTCTHANDNKEFINFSDLQLKPRILYDKDTKHGYYVKRNRNNQEEYDICKRQEVEQITIEKTILNGFCNFENINNCCVYKSSDIYAYGKKMLTIHADGSFNTFFSDIKLKALFQKIKDTIQKNCVTNLINPEVDIEKICEKLALEKTINLSFPGLIDNILFLKFAFHELQGVKSHTLRDLIDETESKDICFPQPAKIFVNDSLYKF